MPFLKNSGAHILFCPSLTRPAPLCDQPRKDVLGRTACMAAIVCIRSYAVNSQRSRVIFAWSASSSCGSTSCMSATSRSSCANSSEGSTLPSAIVSMNESSWRAYCSIKGACVFSSNQLRRSVALLFFLAIGISSLVDFRDCFQKGSDPLVLGVQACSEENPTFSSLCGLCASARNSSPKSCAQRRRGRRDKHRRFRQSRSDPFLKQS